MTLATETTERRNLSVVSIYQEVFASMAHKECETILFYPQERRPLSMRKEVDRIQE